MSSGAGKVAERIQSINISGATLITLCMGNQHFTAIFERHVQMVVTSKIGWPLLHSSSPTPSLNYQSLRAALD